MLDTSHSPFRKIRCPEGDRDLKPVLRTWQIFFIALTAVIGTGAFNNFARASATVGPAGTLVAILIIGVVAASLMEALSEMLQIFRTVNPLVAYTRVFVDPALAKCVAGVYWFSYAAFMAVQFVGAASYVPDMTILERVLLFFVGFPILFTRLNLLPVQYYAWIETVFGVLKSILMLVMAAIMFYVSGKQNGSEFITRGFYGGSALCIVLEYVAFSFLGVEAIAVMSHEAKDKNALKTSSQFIAWIPLLFYLLFAVAINMCFDWSSPNLEIAPLGIGLAVSSTGIRYPSTSPVLQAAASINTPSATLDKLLKAILIICALSAANTTLYISSRMLFGSVKGPEQSAITRPFSHVTNRGIPKYAVFFSAGAFCFWIPFVSLSKSATAQAVIEWAGFAGSIGVLFVWGTTCLAYLRYYYWMKANRTYLQTDELKKYDRFNRIDSSYWTLTHHLQPYPTWVGFMGCILLVFVCPSAQWWGQWSTAHFFQSYLIHILVLVGWIGQKLYERRTTGWREFTWWVEISGKAKDQETFRRALQGFRHGEIPGIEGVEMTKPDNEVERMSGSAVLQHRPQCCDHECGQYSDTETLHNRHHAR